MKLIYRANSLEDANDIKASLEMAGIPAMISGENFSALRLPFFPGNHGVFIYLDEQYNDAIKVMSDPDYLAESAINVETFYQLLDSDEFRHNINSSYVKIFGWIIAVMLVVILLLNFLFY